MSSIIRIKEVFASNFKGFSGDLRVSLYPDSSGSLFLLGGPNGYGKTTVFDILEICIRGELKRTIASFGNVERDNADFGKMPFQNLSNVDVLFSVLLEEESGDGARYHTILRRYPGSSEGRKGKERRNKAASFFPLLETYYSENQAIFGSKQLSDYKKSSDSEIADKFKSLLYGDKTNAADSYLLLNYVQQQDNIHYLTKSERDKSQSIAFLFQTEAKELEDKKLRAIRDLTNQMAKKLAPEVETLKKNLSSLLPGESGVYDRFLSDKLNLKWDFESPFDGIPVANLKNEYESIISALNELKDFVENFDPSEYEKAELRRIFAKLAENELELKGFVWSKLLAPDQFQSFKEAHEKREGFRKYFGLLGLKEELDGLKAYVVSDLESVLGNVEFRRVLSRLGCKVEELSAFDRHLADIVELNSRMGEAKRLGGALDLARRKMHTDLQALHHVHPQSGKCPLCGTDFTSFKLLDDAIKAQIDNSKAQETGLASEKNQIIEEVKTTFFDGAIAKVINQMQEVGTVRKAGIYAELRSLVANVTRFSEIETLLSQQKLPFELIIEANDLTKEKMLLSFQGLKERIDSFVNSLVVNPSKIANDHLYVSLFNREKLLFNSITAERRIAKRLFVDQQYRNASSILLTTFEARLAKLNRLHERLKGYSEAMGQGIKSYKKSLVNMLRIPMYVYSAKILQNCPQGDGIFLSMSKSDTVTFEIDNYSPPPQNGDKHDIVHHLSTGQMAVVSIAFCLALNKLSNTPFKFIAIDDPLQTLDDLNIHSFIELVRHDFQKYQLLFSTHEDHAARYLLYRFYKAGFKVEYMDVKKAFLEPSI